MNPDPPPLQVLIVEDDLGDVALVESAFAEHSIGSQLHHVADGGEALAFLRREGRFAAAPRPDLIMLDLNMPRVDGRQALTEIKADEDLKSIPTIVFTTSAAESDVYETYSAHANAYVTKPINLDDYDRVVMQIRNFYGHIATLPRRSSEAPAT
ncbi:response regulator [Dactylosporangium sp. NPDC049525]|uniref:response regulator n=1 Tax=Dactylosporangium sp. NPDC049525 TaxID=3154730 RepID=UPI0034304038